MDHTLSQVPGTQNKNIFIPTFKELTDKGGLNDDCQPSNLSPLGSSMEVPKSESTEHQFSHSVVSCSLRPHGLQHTRLPCPHISISINH